MRFTMLGVMVMPNPVPQPNGPAAPVDANAGDAVPALMGEIHVPHADAPVDEVVARPIIQDAGQALAATPR